jgi:hypothetical protein
MPRRRRAQLPLDCGRVSVLRIALTNGNTPAEQW